MRRALFALLLLGAPQPAIAQELRQPSAELEAAMAAGDPAVAADRAAQEVEACFESAGVEPTVETLAPCAVLVMMAAQLTQQAGMLEEALEFGEAGTDLGRAAFGENSDIVAYSRYARGLALLELERAPEGREELAMALAAARAVYPAGDPELTPFLSAMAGAELENLDGAKARALLEEAIPIEDDELFLAQLRLQYAVALMLLDEAEGGVAEARAAAEAFARLLGEDSAQAMQARQLATGMAAQAAGAEGPDAAQQQAVAVIPAGEDLQAAFAAQDFPRAERLVTPRLDRCRKDNEGAALGACVDLMNMSALAKISLGYFEEGERLADEAVAVAEASFGPESAQLGGVLITRMKVYRVQGRGAKVVEDGERAVTLLEGYPLEFTFAALDLVDGYLSQSLIEPAEKLLERIGETLQTEDQRTRHAIARADLAMVRSDYDGAVAILEPVLARLPEGPSANRSTIVLRLTVALRNAQRLDEAIALIEPELATFRTIYGNSATMAQALNALGEAYLTAGRYRAALPLLEEAHTLNVALLGDRSPMTGITLVNIAYARMMQGDVALARDLFAQAMDIVTADGNTNLELITKTLLAFGVSSELLGNSADAVALARQALDIAEKFYGPATVLAIEARANLASALSSNGQLDAATLEYGKAYELARKGGAQTAVIAAATASGLARIAAIRDEPDQVRRWLATALTIGKDALDPHGQFMTATYARIGSFELGENERLDIALSYLREAGRLTRARVASYRNFDAEALREMRQLRPVYVRHVEAAWKLQEPG